MTRPSTAATAAGRSARTAAPPRCRARVAAGPRGPRAGTAGTTPQAMAHAGARSVRRGSATHRRLPASTSRALQPLPAGHDQHLPASRCSEPRTRPSSLVALRPVSSRRTERLLNLVICLLHTRSFLTADRIRDLVPGYDETPSEEAFKRAFERDKEDLRDLGIPLETGTNSAFDEEPGYRIARRDYALPEIVLEPRSEEHTSELQSRQYLV